MRNNYLLLQKEIPVTVVKNTFLHAFLEENYSAISFRLELPAVYFSECAIKYLRMLVASATQDFFYANTTHPKMQSVTKD